MAPADTEPQPPMISAVVLHVSDVRSSSLFYQELFRMRETVSSDDACLLLMTPDPRFICGLLGEMRWADHAGWGRLGSSGAQVLRKTLSAAKMRCVDSAGPLIGP
jgi:hypothetical protein